MRTKGIALVAGILLLAPLVSNAEGEAVSRMGALEQRMMALEDQLQSSEATVAAQRQLLNNQAPAAVGEGNRLDNFLGGLEIGGYVNASYGYNFNDPDVNGGSQPLNQFNLNHNTFELDAVKLELGRPTDGAGTAGFQVDMLYGENNNILCGDVEVESPGTVVERARGECLPARCGITDQRATFRPGWPSAGARSAPPGWSRRPRRAAGSRATRSTRARGSRCCRRRGRA